jgi:glycosyltransferase involved in cell wall biosynthesis
MSTKPTVAVIMPCYNNAAYVAEAIESVLRQTLAATEVVVVDDGSTDESARIIGGFAHPVRLLRQSNSGRAAAMNHALAETRCDLIAIIDADDLWRPTLLEKNVAALVDADGVMAYCLGQLCDAQGNDLDRFYGAPMTGDVLGSMLTDNQVFGGGPVLRTDVVRRVGGYDGRFWPCDDYHLWLRAATCGPIVYQPEPLAQYRMHGAQVSRRRAWMARQKLAAKLDFLRLHPEVTRELGRRFIRQATEEQFFNTCLAELRRGNLEAARTMAAHYVRCYPLRIRGFLQLARTLLPWRIHKHLIRSLRKNDNTGFEAALARR